MMFAHLQKAQPAVLRYSIRMNQSRCSVLYINPQGITRNDVDEFKTTFLNSGEGAAKYLFVIEETSLPFRDLLAKTRHDAREACVDVRCPGFLVFDKKSAAKHAVLFVEVFDWVDGVKGMKSRCPSAATTRRFYCAVDRASNLMASIDVACTSWFETWDHVKSAERGAVH